MLWLSDYTFSVTSWVNVFSIPHHILGTGKHSINATGTDTVRDIKNGSRRFLRRNSSGRDILMFFSLYSMNPWPLW